MDGLEGLVLNGVTELGDNIGFGAYAKVYSVKYFETVCAAKQIHNELIDELVSEIDVLSVKRSFTRECLQCSKLRHPNIVQFLGIYYPDNMNPRQLPVMIMEMMKQSLTNAVKQEKIPLHTKFSIVRDVSLGLCFLHSHSPPIIHCDLSPNNILLTAHHVAKISDLGVAKVMSDSRIAPNYGTHDFMSPESCRQNPIYDTPLDVFAFGGIILHTFNQEWPAPSDETRVDPNTGREVALSQVERRQQHIDKLEEDAEDLKLLVEECLDDDPASRPTSRVVVERIQVSKANSTKISPGLMHLVLSGVAKLDCNIGVGAYAKVYAVKYCGVVCAAKQIHDELVSDVGEDERDHMRRRFVRECIHCSKLRHPNIVQFLGVYYPEDVKAYNFPVMIMEKMEESLDSLVTKYNNIPVHIKFSILHDVAVGLYFLHAHKPPIVHHDLSPKNVLLTTNLVAKISDFGVAKVILTNDRMISLTRAPGTLDFMSPESCRQNPCYGTPLDVFAFGGIILHTFNQEWPTPSSATRYNSITAQEIVLSEVDRRKQYIDKLRDDAEPLKPLVKQCLDDDPVIRPLMGEICENIQAKKEQHMKVSFHNLISLYQETMQLRKEINDKCIENDQLRLQVHQNHRLKQQQVSDCIMCDNLDIV